MITRTKQKKCKAPGCTNKFTPRRPMQKGCCFECEVEIALIAAGKSKAKREKVERAADRARREALKTRTQWLREAQAVFNAFIRERDWNQPCISCGRYHDGAYDAGHYRSVGAAAHLRFNEDNVHKQCVPCNQHKAGNIVEYRIRLIDRIGASRVAALEMNNETVKFTIEDAKAIKAVYARKLRELKSDHERTSACL